MAVRVPGAMTMVPLPVPVAMSMSMLVSMAVRTTVSVAVRARLRRLQRVSALCAVSGALEHSTVRPRRQLRDKAPVLRAPVRQVPRTLRRFERCVVEQQAPHLCARAIWHAAAAAEDSRL
jgi:hypothetical protein